MTSIDPEPPFTSSERRGCDPDDTPSGLWTDPSFSPAGFTSVPSIWGPICVDKSGQTTTQTTQFYFNVG